MNSRSRERLIPDPLPFRQGRWFGGSQGGMLTKAEMTAVKKILSGVSSFHPTRSVTNEDDSVAYVSLVRGRYIRETYPDSGRYELTPKGVVYMRQINS